MALFYKNARRIHFYLGSVFAPMILYFALSGAWQVLRLNDEPEDGPPQMLRTLLHELSKPHAHSTLPGLNAKIQSSQLFDGLVLLMALGLILTTLLGMFLAYRASQSQRRQVKVLWFCWALGIVLPILLLCLHA